MVEAMESHLQVAGVQEQGCGVLVNMCYGTDAMGLARRQRAAEAGALEAVAEAIRAHPQAVGVQEEGCRVLRYVCCGIDAGAPARRQRAVEAGAIEAVAGPIIVICRAHRLTPLALGGGRM